jgi:protein O-GlcNAc transferase
MIHRKTRTQERNGQRPGNKGHDRSLAAAIAVHQKGDFESAKQLYETILAQNPRDADALHLLGLIAHQQRRHADAVELMSRSINIEARNAVCHCNLGAALMELGRVDEAIASYDRALVVDPSHANAFVNLGLSLVHSGKCTEALESFESALRLDSGFLSALYNRAKLLVLLKRPEDADEAISAYVGAMSAAPDDMVALKNVGALLQSAGRHDEAIVFLTYAIDAEPASADLYFCRGNVFVSLNRHEEACADFNRVLELEPAHLGALINRGNTFMSRRMFPEALGSYNEVVRQFPGRALGHFNQGNALHELGWWYEALGSYEIALELNPDFDVLPGIIAHLRGRFCQWEGDDAFVGKITSDLAVGRLSSETFPLFMLTDDQALLRKATERWVSINVRPTGRLGALARRPRKDKIHIAYLSGDFHNHATSQLAVEMFERHDRERFEVTAISFGPGKQDAMRKRLVRAFDRFEDVRHLSDLEVAARCRELEVDIAIDLKAYLQDRRPGILAERCAPIQVNWLAFPGTMASPYIDYIVADQTLITPEDLPFYSEKVIWLPDSYQVNDRQRSIAADVVTRTECGLPEEGFVFCCFNNSFKIRPDTFDVWMRILKRVPGSVLWLLGESPVTTENLKREAASRGVAPDRLVFASRMPGAAHLARHGAADLFLDTWPCNAHTTASDALWAGLPVLTRIGGSFSSRVASSLLRAVGLPTLIMRTNKEYEDMAVALANRPDQLASLKRRLRDNRDNCPLFDSARFTRQIEEAYQQVMQRYWAGVAPDNVSLTGKSIGTPVVCGSDSHSTVDKLLFFSDSLSDSDGNFRLFAHRADAVVGGSPPSVSI